LRGGGGPEAPSKYAHVGHKVAHSVNVILMRGLLTTNIVHAWFLCGNQPSMCNKTHECGRIRLRVFVLWILLYTVASFLDRSQTKITSLG